MTTKDKTGGPAFPEKKLEQIPTHIVRGEVKEFREEFRHYSGMTLLDYFAAKAMQQLIAQVAQNKATTIPGSAYNLAEAMIAEKQRRENETK